MYTGITSILSTELHVCFSLLFVSMETHLQETTILNNVKSLTLQVLGSFIMHK